MKNCVVIILICFGVCAISTIAHAENAAELEHFEAKIRPVLVKHCYRCHSVESGKSKGNLLLDSRNGWQRGGDSGPAVIPHKPDESPLLQAISHSGEMSEMPPDKKLSGQILKDFRTWIARGAVDPREGKIATISQHTIDIQEGRKFWSFQPRQQFSGNQSIDQFVQPQAPTAPAEKLVRRLFLDLIGLPPNLEQRREFIRIYDKQSAADAVNTFADWLLSRKEFGEKWARHWLDVARYADSNGGDFNLTFHESWRYRNYVIDAFNDDMPYDQFIREQIAGDLLPADNSAHRNRQLIATGFLMVAPKMLTERNKPKMHLDIADEQVDTIGRAIMGLTLGCARCHDHKFDPIPTSDYYAMTGILHSTRTADGILMNNVNVSGWTETDLAFPEETQRKLATQQARIKQLETEIERKKKALPQIAGVVVDDTDAQKSGPWRKSTYRPNHIGKHYLATDKDKGAYSITWKAKLPQAGHYELRVSFGGGSGLAKKAPYLIKHADGEEEVIVNQTVTPPIDGLWYAIGQFEFGPVSAEQPETIAEITLTNKKAGGHVIADAIQLIYVDDLDAKAPKENASPASELKTLEKELASLKANVPKAFKAMAAQDHSNKWFGDMHIRIRGETKNLGPKVPRGFLQVASYVNAPKPNIPRDQSGRLELAQWLTHAQHPLTSRVMVNRIWQQLFGKGIVTTTDNFGVRGTIPTHPELLDYLAEEFIANNWSTKSLIRKIIESKAYQQEALTATEDDPDNSRLRHQNRRPAPAETIRDSILAIAGQLDSARQESVVEPLGMYAIQTSGKRHESLGRTGELRQRSIYMPIVRGAVPPSLAIFDMPNPDLVTGTRSITTVPAQALFMMNSPFIREMAKAVSVRVNDDQAAIEETIQQLYRQILIRDADISDIAMGKEYITELTNSGSTRNEAVASFVQILFSSTEFRFVE